MCMHMGVQMDMHVCMHTCRVHMGMHMDICIWKVCRALAEVHGLSFSERNHEGNTPLSKAIEHRREHIVTWLLTATRAGTKRTTGTPCTALSRLSPSPLSSRSPVSGSSPTPCEERPL